MGSIPERPPHRLARLAEHGALFTSFFIERHQGWVVAGFSGIFLSLCALLAATKLVWFDEYITYYPAKLPAFQDVWEVYARGTDPHTPTASLLLKAWMAAAGDSPVTDRLLFSIFYLVMCVAIFCFVSRHCPAVYAGAAMIFPALTAAFYWATEIRGYAMVMGFAGLALLCWQRAGEPSNRALWIAGLFVSLAGAICAHYYAAFLWIPFGLAELTRAWVRKRLDIPVWAVLILSPLPVLVFLPGMRAARAIYLTHFWARPYLGLVAITYDDLLKPAVTPVLEAAILCILAAAFLRWNGTTMEAPAPLPDLVLASSLTLLPVIAFPVTFLLGSFEPRFFLPLIAGVSILLAWSVSRAARGDLRTGALLFLFLLAYFAINTVFAARLDASANGGLRVALGEPLRHSDWMRELAQSNLPIAAAPSLWFPQLQFYAPEGVRERLFYPADESLSARYHGQTSLETNLELYGAAGMIPHIVPAGEFLSAHPRFLLCVEENMPAPAWIVNALLDRGAALRLRAQSGPFRVYEVAVDGTDSEQK